jgi:ribosomal protein S18 acetylase RimI-like enzyme
MKIESHRLGFVPTKGLRDAVQDCRVFYATVGGHLVAYMLTSENPVFATIVQLCVHPDFRRQGIATRLFKAFRRSTRKDIHAKVRGDLPANLFWNSTGSIIMESIVHDKSQKLANVYIHHRGGRA